MGQYQLTERLQNTFSSFNKFMGQYQLTERLQNTFSSFIKCMGQYQLTERLPNTFTQSYMQDKNVVTLFWWIHG